MNQPLPVRRQAIRACAATLVACLLAACSPDAQKFKSIDITGADYAKGFALADHNGVQRTLADFKGNEFTRLQIFLYTLVLFAACLLPFVFQMSGKLYLVAAVALSIIFCWYGWKLWRSYSDALARKTFRFSLIHLSLLFAALLLDHYLV